MKLSRVLRGNETLTDLNLANNGIKFKGTKAIAAVLADSKITKLNLRNNRLDENAKAVVRASVSAAGRPIEVLLEAAYLCQDTPPGTPSPWTARASPSTASPSSASGDTK